MRSLQRAKQKTYNRVSAHLQANIKASGAYRDDRVWLCDADGRPAATGRPVTAKNEWRTWRGPGALTGSKSKRLLRETSGVRMCPERYGQVRPATTTRGGGITFQRGACGRYGGTTRDQIAGVTGRYGRMARSSKHMECVREREIGGVGTGSGGDGGGGDNTVGATLIKT